MAKKISVKEKLEKAKIDLASDSSEERGFAQKNTAKLEGDMDFSVKTLKEKINEAHSMTELEATQDYFEGIYGKGAEIPADIQALYDTKVAALNAGKPVASFPVGWVAMTKEQASKYEQEGRLAGYDHEKGCGLIN